MPIYEYYCSACGHKEDILQKVNDAALTQCPVCQKPSFSKQISAPSFHLKGNGWYVTDFRDKGKKPENNSSSE